MNVKDVGRRRFLLRCGKTAALGAAGLGVAAWGYWRQESPQPEIARSLDDLAERFKREETGTFPGLVWTRGKAIPPEKRLAEVDPTAVEELLRRALAALGGMERFVKPGSRVLVKPNAAFASDPRTGSVTDPQTLGAVVRLARQAGARAVLVTDNPIAAPALVFERTGMRRAVEAAGGHVVLPQASRFRRVSIPGAVAIPDWPMFLDILAGVDTVIGVAPVKDHNLCTASLTMKNWYGLLGGRRNQFHQQIHPVICDLWRMMRPTMPLLILDGSRVLLRNGPTGGSSRDVTVRNTIAVGTDPVAIDAFGVTLLDRDPKEVQYLVDAEAAGFGTLDFTLSGKEV
jgi:uncharacterized protein (DUF362 family)